MSLPVLGSMVVVPRISLLANPLLPVVLASASSKLLLSNRLPAFVFSTLCELLSDAITSSTNSPL